ncbi:uncharacterized protein LOC106094493 [Stomoxys calcitrans]|uniref:Uncharacterized protein n=1 Tax=Stomoxys calcitrans TaxID=35570 RepID=A0A1I8PKH2_STOCA|nr:uncharacterized protein LOC106094493 [Stomoxys calcitrans]
MFKFICLLVVLIASTAMAEVDFNNPTQFSYWCPFGSIGPASGNGIESEQAQQILSAVLENISKIDENQYRIDQINTAFKCSYNTDLHEFNANLLDKNDQSKSCVLQIYKNYEKTGNGSTTDTIIACDNDPQYFKSYTDV